MREEYFDPEEELSRERKNLNEIIIGSILFGLTLNLVSDALWDFVDFESSYESFLKIILVIGALTLTFAVILRMVYQAFETKSKIDLNLSLCYFWNAEDGEPINLSGYHPQFHFNSLIKNEFKDESRLLMEKHGSLPPRDVDEKIRIDDKGNYSIDFEGDVEIPASAEQLVIFKAVINRTLQDILGLKMIRLPNSKPRRPTIEFKAKRNKVMLSEMKIVGRFPCKVVVEYTLPVISPLFYNVHLPDYAIAEGADELYVMSDYHRFDEFFDEEEEENTYYFLSGVSLSIKVGIINLYLDRNNAQESIIHWKKKLLSSMKHNSMDYYMKEHIG